MSEIRLDLSIDDANLILEALGQLPFARVYALVGTIQEQASQQLGGTNDEGGAGLGQPLEEPADDDGG